MSLTYGHASGQAVRCEEPVLSRTYVPDELALISCLGFTYV